MTGFLFPPPQVPSLPVAGTSLRYPVRRIFCVGRNYEEHAREMGNEVDREAPFYFTKSPAALAASGAELPYPPGTADFHHEMELVAALGAPLFRAGADETLVAVFGYACGLDMTRRDLQGQAKKKSRPWDTGKDFENAAVIGRILPAADFGVPGPQRISLSINGATRQDAHLRDMVWSLPELLAHLSTLYHLGPGDLVMTGTPAGVGPVVPGDRISGTIDGLDAVELRIGAAD